jgi:hypothetical protein
MWSDCLGQTGKDEEEALECLTGCLKDATPAAQAGVSPVLECLSSKCEDSNPFVEKEEGEDMEEDPFMDEMDLYDLPPQEHPDL